MTRAQIKEKYHEYTIDLKLLVDGAKMFKAIDTHGVPLDLILDRIYESDGALNWIEFIDAALEHGWLVYQIYDKIDYALRDSFYFQKKPKLIELIKQCFMVYVCKTVPEFNNLLKNKSSVDSAPDSPKRFCLNCDEKHVRSELEFITKNMTVNIVDRSIVVPSVLGYHCPVCQECEFAGNEGERFSETVEKLRLKKI